MNFQDLQTIEDYQFYLDLAFKKAKEKVAHKKVQGSRLEKTRTLEKLRVEVAHGVLASKLMKILTSFPSLDALPEFYQKLVKLTLDYPSVKQSLGAVKWAVGQCDSLKRKYTSIIAKGQDIERNRVQRKQYFGRVSSVLKQISKNLATLEAARKTMKGYPTIKTSVFSVALAGFPNIGKTTLLSYLTGSTAEIKAYAFTTKGVNIGYNKTKTIQFLDTPGTLNRMQKMNNVERIAYLTIQLVADVIVYVFDLTEPFPLKDQVKLFRRLKKEGKPVILYLSKTDILKEEQIKEFSKEYDVLTSPDELLKAIQPYLRKYQA